MTEQLSVQCPRCRRPVLAPQGAKKVRCAHCGRSIPLPGEKTAEKPGIS